MITGATGFVGKRLATQLLERGHQVTALVRSLERARALDDLGARLVLGDLADSAAMAAAAQAQEVVVHVAALTGATNEQEFLAANRDGTARLVDAAVNAGVPRFVHVSSAAAGGPAAVGRPRSGAADEVDAPVTGYGRSKLASEVEVRRAPIAWTILRPPAVYGPGDLANFLSVFRMARRMGISPVFGDGSQEISLIHVDDLASAIIAAVENPTVDGGTYYVNHPEVITSRQLVEAIGTAVGRELRVLPLPHWVTRNALKVTGAWAGLFNRKTILHADKAHEFVQPAWTGDPARFIAATGWQPRFDLYTGIADTTAWYRDAGLL